MVFAPLIGFYGPYVVAIAAVAELLAFVPAAVKWVRERWFEPDRLAHLNHLFPEPEPPHWFRHHQWIARFLGYGLIVLTPYWRF